MERKNRYVIKVGSSSITNHEVGLNYAAINKLAAQISQLRKGGTEVALVCSGAVAAGRFLLGDIAEELEDKQVAAAFGQGEVTTAWKNAFRDHGILAAQFLLTGSDLEYPKDSLSGALKRGIPVINANDTVNDKEMKQYSLAADNDELSYYVTNVLDADRYILLTDVQGVKDQNGNVISTISSDAEIDRLSFGEKSKTGTGGMESKVRVAWRAAREGRLSWIASAHEEDVLLKIARDQQVGTRFFTQMGLYLVNNISSRYSDATAGKM